MFTFEKRDEGYMVFDADGRGVCDVTTTEITLDENPKLKAPDRVVTKLPKDKWKVHFCSRKFTPADLECLSKELSAKE